MKIVKDRDSKEIILEIEVRGKRGIGWCKSTPRAVEPFRRLTDRVWSIADLIEAALKAVPTKPTPTPAQRRRQFRVIQGDLFD